MKIWRMTSPLAVALAIVLLITGAAFTFYSERASMAEKIDEVQMQADILSAIVPAALAFDDRQAATEYLTALREDPEIRAAALYDETGAFFAGFSLIEGWSPPPVAPQSDVTGHDSVIVVTPVVQDGTPLGTVMVRSVVEPFSARIVRYGGILLLFIMGALLLGVLGTATRELSSAYDALKARADELASANRELESQIVQREQAEAALRQAQKMETIGQLTGGIAHDFNNLLTIVLGNLERLGRQLQDNPERELRDLSDNAAKGARRAAKLTQSLLAFARQQPLDPRAVEVNHFVNGISDLLRSTLGEKIAIETVAGAGLWRILVDPNQLESTILNLAVNARDAMPEGGKLTIETANTYIDRLYLDEHLGAEIKPGQYVSICISDTGTGMSQEIIDQAFDPFFTTKGVGHGTGLGLSQVYGFVKQSGGHIKIYSEIGQGTTFKVYLPRYEAEDEPQRAQKKTAEPPRGSEKVTVLVVEDEPDVRAHTTSLVRDLGYRVLHAKDGNEALSVLEAHPEVDLLFTDVGLPGGMNGRQLADRAIDEHPSLKVLYTTGYARNAIIHDGRLDRGLHLVTKPFSYSDAGFAIAEALEEDVAETDTAAEPPEATPPQSESTGSPQPKILAVEDEFLILMHLSAELGDLGYEVIEAGSAAAAREALGKMAGSPSAVIVDLGLPDQRGDELAASIRALYPDLLIVIASGYAASDVRSRFADDPQIKFMDKPYDPQTLQRILEACTDGP